MAAPSLLKRVSRYRRIAWESLTAILAAGLFQAAVELTFMNSKLGWRFVLVVRVIHHCCCQGPARCWLV